MALERAVLKVTQRKSKHPLVQVVVDGKLLNVAQGALSHDLTPTDGMKVEFERIQGQPKGIRTVGGEFVEAPTTPPARPPSQTRPARGRGGSMPVRQPDRLPPPTCDFHNPYNFVPAPPRKTDHPDLGDHRPVGQGAIDPQRYAGRICVRMVAHTPLLVPDTENLEESDNGHKTYPLRVDAEGKPLIPASSIRGMLRSAYEAVTNSRFARFAASHQQKLKYRQAQKPFSKVEFPVSPWDLLPDCLRPAAAIDELSPADRVFGWVRTGGHQDPNMCAAQERERVAVRGLLRVGPVTCESTVANAAKSFPAAGVPLAILSTPKPQQGRFYVGKTANGEAQSDGLDKAGAGYQRGKGLRGRKVYPHQGSLPNGHWDTPMDDRTQSPAGTPAHHQEYRRPKKKDGNEQRDGQNHSILGWVRPGAEFTFDLDVHNISQVELGALLWLLSLQDDHFLRFGGGKPLGFGSVRLAIASCDVCTGDELRHRYSAWLSEQCHADVREPAIQSFRLALSEAYSTSNGGGFEGIPFIQAFLVACKGFDDKLPIHYPRATADGKPGPPSPEGESFKWFVANEKDGARYSLRDLSAEPGLPILQDKFGGSRGGGRRGGSGGSR